MRQQARERKAGRERRNEGEVPKVGLGTEHFSQTGRPFARCVRPYNLPMRFCKFLVTRGAIQNICIYVSCCAHSLSLALSFAYVYVRHDEFICPRRLPLTSSAIATIYKWTDIVVLRKRRIHVRLCAVSLSARLLVPPYIHIHTYVTLSVFLSFHFSSYMHFRKS